MMSGEIKVSRLICYLGLVFAVTNHVPTYANTDKQDLATQAPTPAQATISQASAPKDKYRNMRNGLEDRIKALSQALDLDEAQQSQLRKVLENQREQVMKVWGDSSLAPAYRISATQAISENTADQIRALLNEEQRKKYNQPRQSHDMSTRAGKRSVEDWIDATKPKQGEASPNQ